MTACATVVGATPFLDDAVSSGACGMSCAAYWNRPVGSHRNCELRVRSAVHDVTDCRMVRSACWHIALRVDFAVYASVVVAAPRGLHA